MSTVDRRRGFALPIAATILGLAAIGVAEDIPTRHSIEHKLTNSSLAALQQAGIDPTSVSFVGRDGTVRVASPADADRALTIVEDVNGVRVARVIVALGSGPTSPIVTPSTTPSVTITATPSTVPPTAAVPSGAAPSGTTSVGAAVPSGAAAPSGAVLPSGGAPPSGAVVPSGATPPSGAPAAPGGTASGGTPPSGSSTTPSASPTAPPPSASPSGGTATLTQVQAQLGALREITFRSGSATLTARDQSILKQVAAILAKNPGVHIRIQGDTDSTGPAAFNLTLSRSRANAVYKALHGLGIAANRMTVVGYGETKPRVPNNTPANRAINRRVDFAATD